MIKSAVEWLWDISQVRELMAKDFQYAIEIEKKNNHCVDANEMIISDEEIEKAVNEYANVYQCPSELKMCKHDVISAWNNAIKWYREQLKNK